MASLAGNVWGAEVVSLRDATINVGKCQGALLLDTGGRFGRPTQATEPRQEHMFTTANDGEIRQASEMSACRTRGECIIVGKVAMPRDRGLALPLR